MSGEACNNNIHMWWESFLVDHMGWCKSNIAWCRAIANCQITWSNPSVPWQITGRASCVGAEVLALRALAPVLALLLALALLVLAPLWCRRC